MLSEINRSQKDKYSVIPPNEVSEVVKLIEGKSRMMVTRGRGKREDAVQWV